MNATPKDRPFLRTPRENYEQYTAAHEEATKALAALREKMSNLIATGWRISCRSDDLDRAINELGDSKVGEPDWNPRDTSDCHTHS
jgi:hypothetical protein